MLNTILVSDQFRENYHTAYGYTLQYFGAEEAEYFDRCVHTAINRIRSMAYVGTLIIKPAGQNHMTNPRCINAGNYIIVYEANIKHREILLISMFQATKGWRQKIDSYYYD
ncbi:hypothetical protein [Atopobium fossor]|uniref:hypothetical protein n=1 Tax=Atopobium fossor TaxID=39487 RepID=UPI0004846EA5|nr:hypothetical protein [Atopobium fossor]